MLEQPIVVQVLSPIVHSYVQSRSLDKPILVICITDGESLGELRSQASKKMPALWQCIQALIAVLTRTLLCGLAQYAAAMKC